MINFIFKFAQDNCFTLYFYLYNDLFYDFFYAFLVNIFFIFYFLFSLYLLNLISYIRHNFFSDNTFSNFFRFSLSPKIISKEFRELLIGGVFYFYNFLTFLELLIKSVFIVALGFLIFKFPFVDISSSPLLSWKFSSFFSKSRFYTYSSNFFSNRGSYNFVNPISIRTVKYRSPKFIPIEVFRYVRGPKNSTLRGRIRPDPPDLHKIWAVDSAKVLFDLTRKQGINPSSYSHLKKRYFFKWFGKSVRLKAYRQAGKEVFLTPSQKLDREVNVRAPRTYNFLNAGSLSPKRFSLKDQSFDFCLYYRPEGVDRETPKNSFLHTLFFPSGRSKFLFFFSKEPPSDVIPFENFTPTFKYAPFDYYIEPKDTFDKELNEEEFPPAIDDPASFNHFIDFSNAIPGGLIFDKEGFRGIDRYRVFNDLRVFEKKRAKSNYRLGLNHPSLAHPLGYRSVGTVWSGVQRSIKRFKHKELVKGRDYSKKAIFRHRAGERLDFYFRFAIRNEPWPEDLHFLSDKFERPRLWPLDYIEDPAIKVSFIRGDSEPEKGRRSKKRWDFFYDPRGYANLAPRGVFDILSKKFISFLRSKVFFGNRDVSIVNSLPTYNFGASNASRLVPYSTYDIHHYSLFRINDLLGYQQAVFINQRRVKQDPLSNSFKQTLKRRDSYERPLISSKSLVHPIMEEGFLVSKSYRQKTFINKGLFRYIVYPEAFEVKQENETLTSKELKNPLHFIGVRSMFGFVTSLLKGIAQFFLDQSFFLTTRLFGYFNMLNKLPLYLYPVGSAMSKGEALYLNYHLVKLRVFYFFRKLFRALFNRKPQSDPEVSKKFSNVSEIDDFTFFTIQSSFFNSILNSALLIIIFIFNLSSTLILKLSEFFIIHPAVFLLFLFTVLTTFWRRLYPTDVSYSAVVNGFSYKISRYFNSFLKKKFDSFAGFFKGIGFFNDIFAEGTFSRKAGEDSFDYQTRLTRALNFIFNGISKIEVPINNFFSKIGFKNAYDRTMILSYSQPKPRSNKGLGLIFNRIPFSLRLRKNPLKKFVKPLLERILKVYLSIKTRSNKILLKVGKHLQKQKEIFGHKVSKLVYKFRNWLNR